VDEFHWMGLRLLVPVWSTVDGLAVVLAAGAFLALFRFKLGMMKTLAASAAAGLAWHLLAR
jgi:chromate transporter